MNSFQQMRNMSNSSMYNNVSVYFQTGFLCTSLLLGLIGNILVLMVIFKKEILHTISYFILCCLAIADILALVCDIPTAIVALQVSFLQHCKAWCNIQGYVHFTTGIISLVFYCLISVDRYIYIRVGLCYYRSHWVRFSKAIIAGIWLAGLISGIYPIVKGNFKYHDSLLVCTALGSFRVRDNSYLSTLSLLIIFPCFISLILTQILCYRLAYRMIKKPDQSKATPESNFLPILRHFIATILPVSLIVVVFLFSWALYACLLIFHKKRPLSANEDVYQMVMRSFGLLFITVPHLCNPFIYVTFDKKFCHCFRLIFCRNRVSRSVNIPSVS